MVASFLAFDKPAFKKVYMHGFVTDVLGVKMSKTLGNIISPYEVIDKHGADVVRSYLCQTAAGEDLNFSWEECAQKQRNLNILWNLHKLLITLAKENKMNPYKMSKRVQKVLDLEEKYIVSKLHSTIKNVTELLEKYRLDETIAPVEQLFLSLSRTYVQMVREKSSVGEEEDKEKVIYTLGYVLLETLKMLSVVAPFISEAVYLNLQEEFKLKEKSLSHYSWPVFDMIKIDAQLETHLEAAQEIIQAALHAREKAKLGLRWPVQEVLIVSSLPAVSELIVGLRPILTTPINAKSIRMVDKVPGVTMKVKPEYAKLGQVFGNLSPSIITILIGTSPETIIGNFERAGFYALNLDGKEIKLMKEMVTIERSVPPPFIESTFSSGMVYLNTSRTLELEAEGYAREVMRKVQQLRKDAGLQKWDRITLVVKASATMKPLLERWSKDIEQKVGADEILIVTEEPVQKYGHASEFTVKKEMFTVWLEKK